MNVNRHIKRPFWIIAICLCVVSAIALFTAVHNIARGCACTDNANTIFNILGDIDAAKMQWVIDHPGVKKKEFSEQDLSAYIESTNIWKGVAGEIYLLHGPGEPTEALTTRQVDGVPPGMIMRVGLDQKARVLTNIIVSANPQK